MNDAKRYQREKLRLYFLGVAVDLCALLVLQATGASERVALAAAGAPFRLAEIALYMLVFFHGPWLAGLPLRFYAGHVVERRWNLSTQASGAWFFDEFKRWVLGLAFFVPTMTGLVWVMDSCGSSWWMAAAAGWTLVTLFVSTIFPTVIIPIFYPVKPVTGELRERIAELFARFGVRLVGVYELALSKKTKKANAMLAGIGNARRVYLGDTLLGGFEPDETRMVVAHELGHHVLRHIPKGLAFHTVAAAAGFFLLDRIGGPLVRAAGGYALWDLAVFPTVALLSTLGALAFVPAQNAFSRRMEYEADAFALKAFPSRATFESLMRRLASKNLADTDPDPFVEFVFYSHPSISNRVKRAQSLPS